MMKIYKYLTTCALVLLLSQFAFAQNHLRTNFGVKLKVQYQLIHFLLLV